MPFLIILLLAIIQGFAELLPVSSSAHVILTERILGLDPSSPEMTFLLVMLHTGTMFAVIVYFWKKWKLIFQDRNQLKVFIKNLFLATIVTGVLGLSLKFIIEKFILEKWLGYPHGEIEQLFKNLPLMAASLFFVGLLIIYSAKVKNKNISSTLNTNDSVIIGLVQGLALPFRGFSRSGSTISTGLLLGKNRNISEEFSFALAVVLTPAVLFLEIKRYMSSSGFHSNSLSELLAPGFLGMVLSFISGLIALRWLSNWLEKEKWNYFGYYCIVFSVATLIINWTFIVSENFRIAPPGN
jgi:undecaprenyl-diphosphatase